MLNKQEIANLESLLSRAKESGQLQVICESTGIGGRALEIDRVEDVVNEDDSVHDEVWVGLSCEVVNYLQSGDHQDMYAIYDALDS